MDAIARAAGVAVQTVYLVFHTKPELLIETLMVQAWGPDPRAPAARSWIQEAAEAPDGARRLAIAVDAGVEIYRRAAPLFPAVISASSVEPDVRTAWQRIAEERHASMSQLVGRMHDRGELREGLPAAHATDIVDGLHRHDLYLAFIRERGWSVETFKAWLYATLCHQLLPAAVATAALATDSPAVTGTSFRAALAELP
jgi:AcrR family transcriptional regulator